MSYSVIGIDAPEGVPLDLVLKDVATAIAEGYGAGSIMPDDYQEEIGFWTSLEQNLEPAYTIVIRSDVPLSKYAMADLVLKYKPEAI